MAGHIAGRGLAAMFVAVVVGTIIGAIAGMSRGAVGSADVADGPLLVAAGAAPATARDLSLPPASRPCSSRRRRLILIVIVIGGLR